MFLRTLKPPWRRWECLYAGESMRRLSIEPPSSADSLSDNTSVRIRPAGEIHQHL